MLFIESAKAGSSTEWRFLPIRGRTLWGILPRVGGPKVLIGRDDDAARVNKAVGGRFTTIFGPAGVGKTQLAQAIAVDAIWIDVSGLITTGQLQHAIARSLGIETVEDFERAIGMKGAKLLVLDDCERLDPTARASISTWLLAAPGLRILATSREILGEPDEQVITLAPLDRSAAQTLFLERAEKARGMAFTPSPALDALLLRLDGLPLAIELAAAWCDALSVEDLLRRWDALLPALDASLAASYALLDENARHHFQAAALFAGDFALDDLEAVAEGVDPGSLATLVRKSLLQVEWLPNARYRMLETIKTFGRARAKEQCGCERLEDRHARRALTSGDVPELSLAHERVAKRDPLLGVELVLAMDPMLYDRGPFEHHLAWIDKGLAELPGGEPPLRAALLHARARCLRVRGRMQEAYEELLRAEALDAPALRPSILRMLGVIHRHRGQAQQAEDRLLEARALAKAEGNDRVAMCALDDLGIVALDAGRLEEAKRRFKTAEQLAAKIDDARYRAIIVAHQGLALHLEGNLVQARIKYGEAVDGHRRCGDRRFEGWALGFLAILFFEVGAIAEADEQSDLALELYRSIGDARTRAFLWMPRLVASWARRDQPALLRQLQAARTGLDPIEDASQLAALSLLDDVDTSPSSIEERLMMRLLAAARGAQLLFVGPNGSWFEAEGVARVSLTRRRPLQRLLHRLVEAHVESANRGLDWSELLAAGWPGEKILPEAGARRVYVAIATLRKLGLQAWLTRNEQGYLLSGRIEQAENLN